ncbi:MAG: acetamidase/formamidase family protein [Burkholderiaceae bacterium]
MNAYTLAASVETCHWGLFDAALPPVLHVKSGDRVVIDTVSGGPNALPPASFLVPPELLDIHARSERHEPGHILTGPVHVAGAEPGDTLEVRVLDVTLRQDWGYNVIRPLAGTLPADFDTSSRLINIPLDRERLTGRMPWGLDLPLHPFFGVMGVAPPPRWGRISTIVPRAHGGNLDNKELGPGSSLFLPVHVPGALFSCGDGHAAQGDGEVCTTAIETALQGTFELVVHKRTQLAYPRGETPTHLITMGMDPDLDQCLAIALRDMIVLIGERAGLSREDAYTLCSLAVDFRITQTVNVHRGVHAMLPKALLR